MTIKPLIHSSSATIPSWYTPITEEVLYEMTRRIVEAVEPEKIILFGSYAYGQPEFHSDIDLLVVPIFIAIKASLSVIASLQLRRAHAVWRWT